jgi:hypothetical protein
MLTADEIQALLIKMLVEAAGGEPAHWRGLIGDVIVFPRATHPTCNWRIVPSGEPAQVAAINLAVELVRQEHPHARRG